MRRPLLANIAAAAIFVTAGGAVGSEAAKHYNLENGWPSKLSGDNSPKKDVVKGATIAQAKESKEKGGTEDINIGVGELQEGKGKKGLAAKKKSPRALNPKEFKLDQKATWKAAPKTKTLCTTPDGKRRAC